MVTGDAAYGYALLYYTSVREQARRRVPAAETVFRFLQQFFRRGHNNANEPTEAQIMHDVKALLHGKKDGEIVIEGTAKHTTAAEKSVVDDVHKPQRQNFKETVKGTVCNHCNTENGEGYKFCKECGKKF